MILRYKIEGSINMLQYDVTATGWGSQDGEVSDRLDAIDRWDWEGDWDDSQFSKTLRSAYITQVYDALDKGWFERYSDEY